MNATADVVLTAPARDWNDLGPVVERSMQIEHALEFFLWMRGDVCAYLPHDLLLAAWGDFEQGQICYDVVSSYGDVPSCHAMRDARLDPLAGSLYRRGIAQDAGWFGMNGLALQFGDPGPRHAALLERLSHMRSLLAWAIQDRRTGQGAVYLFLSESCPVACEPRALRALLPHIDGALRRIAFARPTADEPAQTGIALSTREREIMTWIRHGKTNEEIAIILGISANTVKNHLKRLFRKLDVTNRTQAVARFHLSFEAGVPTATPVRTLDPMGRPGET